jgi:hypothetical protein
MKPCSFTDVLGVTEVLGRGDHTHAVVYDCDEPSQKGQGFNSMNETHGPPNTSFLQKCCSVFLHDSEDDVEFCKRLTIDGGVTLIPVRHAALAVPERQDMREVSLYKSGCLCACCCFTHAYLWHGANVLNS